GGVDEPREEHAVEEHPTGLVVDLVLVAASLGNLDDGVVGGHGLCSLLLAIAGITLLDDVPPPAPHPGDRRCAAGGTRIACAAHGVPSPGPGACRRTTGTGRPERRT